MRNLQGVLGNFLNFIFFGVGGDAEVRGCVGAGDAGDAGYGERAAFPGTRFFWQKKAVQKNCTWEFFSGVRFYDEKAKRGRAMRAPTTI